MKVDIPEPYLNYITAIGKIKAILEMNHLSDVEKVGRIEGVINFFRKELEELLSEEDIEKIVLNNGSVIIPIKTENTVRGKIRY